MEKKIIKLRDCVGIILARKDGKVWTGKRKLGIGVRIGEKNLWQMPQGGIDEGETPEEAAFRELKEETGSDSAIIILEIKEWLEYYLPKGLIGKALRGKYEGQRQKWFLMFFTGDDREFNLNTHKPEFEDWAWRDLESMPELVVDFKKDVYQEIVKKLSPVKEKLNT